MQGQDFIDVLDVVIGLGNLSDALNHLRVGTLADQQPGLRLASGLHSSRPAAGAAWGSAARRACETNGGGIATTTWRAV